MEVVFYSDVVVSQWSSIVLDALYYLKPFVTYSFSDDRVITDFMPISKEAFVFKASDSSTLATLLQDIFSNQDAYLAKMKEVRHDYLYHTDGQASERVFQLLMKQL